MKALVNLRNAVISNPLRRLAKPINFELNPGEHIALVGLNGSGKSTLIGMLTGAFYLREGSLECNFKTDSYKAYIIVNFNGAYSTTEFPYYYQQRWHSFERENSVTVASLLDKEMAVSDKWRSELYELLDIGRLLQKEIITLSSGELRRYHIAKALLSAPELLILECPFIGLDPPTRKMLNEIMILVSEKLKISFVLTMTEIDDLPKVITHLYFLKEGACSEKYSREQALALPKPSVGISEISDLSFLKKEAKHYNLVVQMRNVTVAYGSKVLFDKLNWTVKDGQAWNITGPNGSGKSTLLSLICADNPKAYSLDLTLFDVKRGSGESIWEIKKHIGYLSNELHSSFRDNLPVIDIVSSGMTDGYISQTTPNQARDRAVLLLQAFQAAHLKDRLYMSLSSGEQRLVLLARSFAKNPDLLILDEPFQGLDAVNRAKARSIIETFFSLGGRTLLFVTHFPEELPSIIDYTLTLRG